MTSFYKQPPQIYDEMKKNNILYSSSESLTPVMLPVWKHMHSEVPSEYFNNLSIKNIKKNYSYGIQENI